MILAQKNWAIVSNRIKAEIYTVTPSKKLRFLRQIENPLGRLRNRAMRRDKPGNMVPRGRVSTIRGRSSQILFPKTGKTDQHEDAAVQFARRICSYLEKYGHQGVFKDLIVAAEPHFMGILKKQMSKQVKAHVVKWVNKDLEKTSRKNLPEHLGIDALLMER